MASFVRHESCPKCGSRDNLGRYSDGGAYCFGCHYREGPDSNEYRPAFGRVVDSQRETAPLVQGIPREAVAAYLHRYGLTVHELLAYRPFFGERGTSLGFEYRDKEGTIVATQTRNLDPSYRTKTKYFNVGTTYSVFDLMSPHRGTKVVITEDKLSAIKVARHVDAIPALGTVFQLHKIVELKNRGYQSIVVWLDQDKWREGREIADQAKWLGLSAKALLTEKDPKEYTDEQILEYLK
jgi:twinkle protein